MGRQTDDQLSSVVGRPSSVVPSGRRATLVRAMTALADYERELGAYLIEGLQTVPGLKIWGITDPAKLSRRVPTVSFTLEGWHPRRLAERLGEAGIYVWDGNYYAVNVTERLGLEDKGGMLRVGLAHYNTRQEVERLVATLGGLAGAG